MSGGDAPRGTAARWSGIAGRYVHPNDYGAREVLARPHLREWVCADCGRQARPEPCPDHRALGAAPMHVVLPGQEVGHTPDSSAPGRARCGLDITTAVPCWYPDSGCGGCMPRADSGMAAADGEDAVQDALIDLGGEVP